MQSITFYNKDTKTQLPAKKRLKAFLMDFVGSKSYHIESVSIILCTDKYVREMNKKYLGHDYVTDILTFELPASGIQIEGELYISVDTVKRNSSDLNIPFLTELHRVIFHGVLHLLGYNDATAGEIKKIRKLEDLLLIQYSKYL